MAPVSQIFMTYPNIRSVPYYFHWTCSSVATREHDASSVDAWAGTDAGTGARAWSIGHPQVGPRLDDDRPGKACETARLWPVLGAGNPVREQVGAAVPAGQRFLALATPCAYTIPSPEVVNW